MLLGKKKKISKYLSEKQAIKNITAFDSLLSEYLSGCLKENFRKLNIKQTEIHVDWLSDYKCINIQGRIGGYFVDIQIEPETFLIAYDKDESDNATEFAMQDVPTFYSIIKNTVEGIK